MPYLDQLRSALGAAAENRTDEDLLRLVSDATKRPLGQIADEYGYDPGKGSMWGERMSAGIDRYQAGLYEFGAHAARAAGMENWGGLLDERRRANEVQGEVAAGRAANLGGIDRWADVHGVGDFGNYVGGLAVQSLPYAGEAILGGMAGRAIIGGGRALAGTAGAVGGMAAGIPSAGGDILGSQRDQAGTTDFGSALTLAPIYSGLNMLGGVEGTLARGQIARSGISALDNLTGVGGVAARTAASVGKSALVEGVTETAQEGVNQIGRMAVDPNAELLDDAALERYGESAIGGAALGGLFGGAAGGWRRSEGYSRPALTETGNLLDPSNPVVTVPQGPTPPPLPGDGGVPLTGVAPEVIMPPPPPPPEPVIVAGVDATETAAKAQELIQERQQAVAELGAFLPEGVKPKGAQIETYRDARRMRDAFSDEEFQELAAKIAAGDVKEARAEMKLRTKQKGTDVGSADAPGPQAGGSAAGGSPVVAGGVGDPGQVAGVPAVLGPVQPGASSLPARVAAGQQQPPALTAPAQNAPLTKAAPEGAANKTSTAVAQTSTSTAVAAGKSTPTVTVKKVRKITKATDAVAVAKQESPQDPKAAIRERLMKLDPKRRQMVYDALGVDQEGHEVAAPMEYEEVAKKHGVSKQYVGQVLGGVGITKDVIERFAGAEMPSVSRDEVLGRTNEEGAATGFRETDRPTDTDDVVEKKGVLEREADKLLAAAGLKKLKGKAKDEPLKALPDAKFALPGSKTAEFLEKKRLEREAQKKAADEALEKKRQEYAAKLREDAAKYNKDLEPGPNQEPPADYELADVEGAERDWQDSRRGDDAEWSELSDEQRTRYIRYYRQNFDGKLGERGRDYLDDLFDKFNGEVKAKRAAAPKEEYTPVVGDGTQAKVAVTTKKKRTIVKPEGPAAVNDPQRQKELVREAIKRKHARMQGKEVAPREQIKVRPRLNKLLKDYSDGKITADDMAREIDDIAEGLESKALDQRFKGGAERATGADYIRERLLQAKRRGDLPPEMVDFAEWFILRNPKLADELGISVRKGKDDGMGGRYSPIYRTVILFKGARDTQVVVHELLHHLERMMPEETQGEVRTLWAKAVAKAAKQAAKAGDTKRMAYFERVLRANAEMNLSEQELAIKMVTDGDVPFEDYAYLNPSEFWAVNMAADQEARFDARNSLWEKTKLWLKDALDWAKMVLGLNSRTPMVRALRAVMAGDGEFQSTSMLGEGESFNALEGDSRGPDDQPPGGKPAGANRSQARAGVQAPVQGRAPAGQGSNRGAVASANGVGNGGAQPPAGGAPAGLGDLPPPPGKPAKLKGWIDSIVAGKWRSAPWLLGTLSTEQLAERFKDLPGNGGKALRAFHQGMQRMAQRANSLITDSDRIKRQWETLRSRHGDKADEAFTDFLLESTRMRIWGMHPLDTDYEAEDNPNRHLAKVKKLEDGTKVLEYDADTRTRHAQLAQQWRGLNADYQKFFETLQADFQKKYEAKVEGFRQNIVAGHYLPDGAAMGHDVVDRAAKLEKKDRAAFASQHAKSKIERDTLRSLWADLDEHASEFPKEMKGPYFPLMRFGEHIVSVKSQGYRNAEAKLVEENAALEALLNAPVSGRVAELEERLEAYRQELPKAKSEEERNTLAMKIVSAEAELDKAREPIKEARKKRNAAKKELARLKGSENDYVVEFYETLGEAKARYDQLSAHYANQEDVQVEQKLKDRYLREVDGVTPTFLKKVEDNLAAELPASERNAVKQTMREMYLQMLPETSAMKSQMKRKNVAGVRADQGLRSFSASSVRDAWYISRLENREPVRAALNELRFSDDVDTKLIGNELAMRVAQNWHFDNRQWMGAVTNVTYMAYLGMSPAFIVTQITQPWVISAPVMAARHGAGTAGQLWRGWKQARQLMKLNKKAEGTINYTLDPAAGLKAGILTAGEAGMLKEMLDSGRIDITITHDLGAAAAGRSEGLLGKAVRLSAIPAQQAEILNRVSTALAAYRMEKARLMGEGKGDADATRAARDYADRIVAETHLNYAPENRARLMHPNSFGGWGRIMWQFRSYQQGMLYLTLKNLFDAVKGDKEARRAVVYLAGMQLAVAGTSGLPIAFPAGLVATLIYKMLTDDDEEKDLKELYRQTIADIAGDTAATLVTKGAPAAFLGVDMSKRIGMGNIFNPVPYADDRAEGRDWVAAHWLALAGGAPLGYAGNVAEGIKAASEGDFAKAFAWAVPWKVAADLARGGSQAVRGMVDSRGNTIMAPEELGYEDAVLKMLGFPVQSVERVREQRNAFFEARENRTEGRSAIMRELVQARLAGEPVDMSALQDWNARHPDNRITYSDVLQQVKAKREEQRTMQRTGGVPVKKSDRALASELGIQ